MEPTSYPALPRLSEIPDNLDAEISRRLLAEVAASRSAATISSLRGATGALKALASLHEPGFRPEQVPLDQACIKEIRHAVGEKLSFVRTSPFLAVISPDGSARLTNVIDGTERAVPLDDRRSGDPVFLRVASTPGALFSGYADGELRMHCLFSGALVFKHRVDGSITGAAVSTDGRELAVAYSERRYHDDHVLRFGMSPTKPMRDGVGTIDVLSRENTMYGERWCRRGSFASRYGEDGYLYEPTFADGSVITATKDKIYSLAADGSGESRLYSREPDAVLRGQRITRLEVTPGADTFAVSTADGALRYGSSLSSLERIEDVSCFALNGRAAQIAICDGEGKLTLYWIRDRSLEACAEARLPVRVDSLAFSPGGKGLLARAQGVSFLLFDHPELHAR